MADWAALLSEGDFSGARAAWQRKAADRTDAPEASWELAEIEERWGDSLFFAWEAGAAEHYRVAQAALVPPGSQFTSFEENDRRMRAYQRVTNKLYAIDPYGRPRPGHDGRPHPNSSRARLSSSRETTLKQQSEYAELFQDSGHWRHYYLGTKWRQAGKALAGLYPEAARRAFAWSMHFFELYNKAWAAHLPSSRWDSDGDAEMMEVRNLMDSLGECRTEPPLPAWVGALLTGDWQRALAAAGAGPLAPEWNSLAVLLAEACQAAGRKDAGRRLLEPQVSTPKDPA